MFCENEENGVVDIMAARADPKPSAKTPPRKCLPVISVFGALIVSIPLPVLGGAGLMMFAMIIAAGIQMLDKVARSKRNGLIIAISIGCGLAVTTRPELLDKLPHFFKEVLGSGITVGSLLALILNLVLPEDKVEETKE